MEAGGPRNPPRIGDGGSRPADASADWTRVVYHFDDAAQVQGFAAERDGGTVISGFFRDSIELGGVNYWIGDVGIDADISVVRIGPQARVRWVKVFGHDGPSIGSFLRVLHAGDELFVAGRLAGNSGAVDHGHIDGSFAAHRPGGRLPGCRGDAHRLVDDAPGSDRQVTILRLRRLETLAAVLEAGASRPAGLEMKELDLSIRPLHRMSQACGGELLENPWISIGTAVAPGMGMRNPLPILVTLVVIPWTSALAQVQLGPSPLVSLHLSVRPASTSGYLPAPDNGPIGDYSGYTSHGTDGKNTYAPNRYHQVYRPPALTYCATPPLCLAKRLVVFIPGHTFQPSDYTSFLETARDAGFYVIGLDYPNPHPESTACAGVPSCFGSMRDKIVFADGTFTGSGVDFDSHPQDAMMKRLKALLLYLEDHDPYGGWGTYLDEDDTAEDGVRPAFANIVFVDHSGYAPFIASKKAVSRVVMLASVIDSTGTATSPASATWIDSANPTDSSLYFGIVNTLDNCPGNTGATFNHYPRIEHNWTKLGMTDPQGIEVTDSCSCSNALACHMSVAQDPSHASDWLTMLGPLF